MEVKKMSTQEAIEFLDHMANSFKCISSLNCKSINNKKNEIVELLQQGEKYQQMWEEARSWFLSDLDLDEYMIELEQKYFPKEMKSDEVA